MKTRMQIIKEALLNELNEPLMTLNQFAMRHDPEGMANAKDPRVHAIGVYRAAASADLGRAKGIMQGALGAVGAASDPRKRQEILASSGAVPAARRGITRMGGLIRAAGRLLKLSGDGTEK